MPTPDTKHSIVIKKTGPYRGTTREWSNRYHFEGSLPADDTHWETFADHIVALEKTCLNSVTEIVEAIGYNAGTATSTNPHGDAVWTKTYSVAGTFSPAVGDNPAPGDAAAIIRYDTDARSTKNHPVYLFNYYHSAYMSGTNSDNLAADQKTLLEAYADQWITGFSDGAITRERCGPRGAVSTGRRVDPFIRHRDFPN